MLESLTGLLASGGATGIVGLFGGIANRWVDHKTTVAKMKFKEKEFEYREKELRIESDTNLKLQRMATEADIEKDAMAADTANQQLTSGDYRAAMKADRATYSAASLVWYHPLVWVDFLRGTVRIVAVYALLWMTFTICQQLDILHTVQTMSMEQRFEMMMKVVTSIFGLTTMAVGFWFGNRPSGGHKS